MNARPTEDSILRKLRFLFGSAQAGPPLSMTIQQVVDTLKYWGEICPAAVLRPHLVVVAHEGLIEYDGVTVRSRVGVGEE